MATTTSEALEQAKRDVALLLAFIDHLAPIALDTAMRAWGWSREERGEVYRLCERAVLRGDDVPSAIRRAITASTDAKESQ